MKTDFSTTINYGRDILKMKVSKEKTFPNDLLKVEFENSKLLQILESAVWIEEKEKVLLFKHTSIKSVEQMELLNSIALGIEGY